LDHEQGEKSESRENQAIYDASGDAIPQGAALKPNSSCFSPDFVAVVVQTLSPAKKIAHGIPDMLGLLDQTVLYF
jgi:hypothetical protein